MQGDSNEMGTFTSRRKWEIVLASNSGEDVEKLGHSYFADDNVKW